MEDARRLERAPDLERAGLAAALTDGFAVLEGRGFGLGRERGHVGQQVAEAFEQGVVPPRGRAGVDRGEEFPLVEGGSDEQWNVARGAAANRVDRLLGDQVAVHHGQERHHVLQVGEASVHGALRLEQLLCGDSRE